MKYKNLYDLSQPVFHNCPCWPTLDPPTVEKVYYIPREDANVEKINMITHTGTHVDSPYHKLAEGKTLDQIPIHEWIGEGIVADVSFLGERQLITAEVLEDKASHMKEGDMVMLYTGWSNYRSFSKKYCMDWPGLDESGASWLVDKKVKAVGTDAFSVDLFDDYLDPDQGVVAHKVLLGAEVPLIEEAYLAEIAKLGTKRWMFFCLPVAIDGAGGAPARIIAIDEG
jgi:kynurenine formamidase